MPKVSLGVTFHVPGSARECEGMSFQLPNELSFWELESQWTFKISEGDCKDQNSLDSKVPYIIEIFLKHRCLK
jgi:hypothetical protein